MTLPKHVSNPDPNIYLSDNYITLDVETTNKEKGDCLNPDNRLLIVTYKLPGEEVQGQWWGEYDVPQWFFETLENADFIVGHNLKFDLGWLRRAGLDLSKVVLWDTQIAEYVRYGNLTTTPFGLDKTLERYGIVGKDSLIKKMLDAGICPSEMPESLLMRYAIKDSKQTDLLFQQQRAYIFPNGLDRTLYTHCLFTPVLTDMEAQGMQLAEEHVRPIYENIKEEYDELVQKFNEFAEGVNFKSPKQVAELLYDKLGFEEPTDRKGNPIRTPKGNRKADVNVISSLKPKTKDQKEFIKLNSALADKGAKLDKALDKMIQCIDNDGGTLYATFNQTITQTHRLSSSGKRYKIQFQNMFRDFKPLFKAKQEGWKIGETDGAQLEFRIAAWYGQDDRAMYDIDHDVDVHQFTAYTITAAGQKTDRQGAKAHTFKPLFGGRSGTKAEQAYYKEFRAKYPGIDSTQTSWIDEVLRTKSLLLPTGMRFYWPDTELQPSGYVTNTTAISNYPIQYFATGEIIPIAVVSLWHRMRANNMQTKIVNTIHDSAISEIHPDEGELYEELAVQSFTSDVYSYLLKLYNIDFNVTLDTETKILPYWNYSEKWATTWNIK